MPPQKPAQTSVQTSFELNQSGPIKPVEFHEIFGQNYGVYGLHVVQERALPDARDGLKPVQRRILYTLWEGNYRASGPHRKSAEIVGKVLGDRHPHGDSSVYEAMVRMVQPFTMRYPFVDGQGNWGASDGSPAAAYRYTEAKLTQLAEALLSDDLRKETVPLDLTYKEDSKVLEPRYLPGHLPPCVNPIDGIAVGISTAVPPHNLGETLRACIAMLDEGVLDGKGTGTGTGFSTEQLMEYLPGPDFPEGGRVMLASGGVREYLETGRGRFVVRADISLEQLTPTRRALVITGLPPTSRDKVITSIIDAINDRRPGLEGLVAEPPLDETNEARTRIVLELKRDANPALVLDSLYKHTLLQIGVSAQLYFLFADQPQAAATRPRQIGMVELLTYWLHHQLDVLERRLSFELRQYRHRLAVVEALIIGATHAQELVKIFQNAEGKAAAKLTIQAKYKLSEEQAEVIANMSLSQVTRPDAGKYQQEKAELEKQIGGHEALLSSRDRRIALLKKELQETAKKFGDARRTVLDSSEMAGVGAGGAASTSPSGGSTAGVSGENKVSATATATATVLKPAVVREPLALALYSDGTIKATPLDQFGPKTKTVKSDENLTELVAVPGEAFVLAASSAGRIFGVPVEKLAVTNRGGKGESLVRHLKLERGERIVSLLTVPASAFEAAQGQSGADQTAEAGQALLLYLVEVSAQGKIKKTALSEYKTANSGGLSSLKLGQGDEVVAALLSNGQGEYVLTADNNQTLRFGDDKLSAQGRVGQGQNAMALDGGARIISAGFWSGTGSEAGTGGAAEAEAQAEAGACLIVLTKKGLLKRTPLGEYPAKGRATGGVVTTLLNVGDSVVATRLVRLTQTLPQPLLVASGEGAVAVVELATQIPLLARAKKGQPLPGSASPGNNGVTNGTGSGSKTARLVPLALKLG